MFILRPAIFLAIVMTAAGCSTTSAPIIDRTPGTQSSKTQPATTSKSSASKSTAKISAGKSGDWRPDTYTVKKGDTLFSIGLEHGYDYKDIARVNNIEPPYVIKVGQTLKFSPLKEKTEVADSKISPAKDNNSDGVVTYPLNQDGTAKSTENGNTASQPVTLNSPKALREPYSEEAIKKPSASAAVNEKTEAASAKTPTKPAIENKSDTKAVSEPVSDFSWSWPTKGKVISNFNENGNKGIDIAGTKGQAVTAAAPGKVIYSGSDLRGYGKLVIIKHNSTYLSVYANNSNLLVKEGQQISAGQKIAEMGDTDSNVVKLHFEIRQLGKSIDPMKFLAAN